MEPTLPKPCTTTRCPRSCLPMRSSAASMQIMTPRPVASARSADAQGLARHHTRRVLSQMHRYRVHDPRHRLRVRADIGRRHVLVRSDDLDDLGGVTARQAFELALRKLRWIACDAALTAAERQVDDGAFPGHPERERSHLVERDAGVVANAALGGPAR